MYRTAKLQGVPDTAVVCRECGVTATAFAGEAQHADFTCRRCNAKQPVLRGADDLKVHSIALVHHEPTTAYEELGLLLQSFGVSGKATQVSIECDGIRILVSLSLNSGAVVGLDMAAHAPHLPAVTLQREVSIHLEAKSKGIVHEAQTGDPAFDAAVYIDSPLRDEDLRVVLAAPAVRAAVLKLLGVAPYIRIGNGYVTITIPKDDAPFKPLAIRERLGWLRVVAGATRPLVTEDVPVPLVTSIAKIATFLMLPAGLGASLLGGIQFGTLDTQPYLIGLAVGLVLSLLLHPLFRRALSGRSGSHRDILLSRVASLIFLPPFMMGALLIYNGAMDRSPERVVVMKVVSTSVDSEDRLKAVAVDDEGKTYSYTFVTTPPTAAARVSVTRHAGALGWTWESGRAVLSVGGH